MTNILFSLFSFIITISFLVFIHEFGHFWVARRFGVRIEKFSVGFGKPIIKWNGKRDNTEYSLSWIPLGGYVKMYGESSNDPSDNSDVDSDTKSIDDSVALDNKSRDVNKQTSVDLSRDLAGESNTLNNTDNIDDSKGSFSALPPFKRLLIAFAGPAVNLIFAILALWALFIIGVPALNPTIGSINQTSMLTNSGIGKGDTIVSINGYDTTTMTDATLALVGALGSEKVTFTVKTASGEHKTASLDLSTYEAGNEMAVGKLVGFNWAIDEVVKNQPAIIQAVSKGTPAEKAGLKTGDKILSAGDITLSSWQDFVDAVNSRPNQTLQLAIERNGQKKTLTMVVGEHPRDKSLGYAGVSPQVNRNAFDKFRTSKRYGIFEALPKSIVANYVQGELMLKTLGRLISGKASVENLGGPLTIADYSGRSLSAGYVTYFHFLASISLILAVMNLLPIPVLDGGHILMCLVEMVRRKPLSDKALELFMRVGGSVLLTFMLFTISVDVWRYLFK